MDVPGELRTTEFDNIRAANWPGYNQTTIVQPVDAMLERVLGMIEREGWSCQWRNQQTKRNANHQGALRERLTTTREHK